MKNLSPNYLLVSLFISFFSLFSFAENYSTIANGSWDDKESVWSLDEVTPCHCSPGTNTNGNTITIKHTTRMSYNLSINKGSILTISKNGVLAGDYEINNVEGTINNSGVIEIAKYKQGSKSSFNLLPDAFVEIFHSTSIGKGALNMDNSKFVQSSGNMIVSSKGKLNITNNALVEMEYGDILSKGKIILSNSSKLYIAEKAFTSKKSDKDPTLERTILKNKSLIKTRKRSLKKL